jgi:hypothetical protein
VEERGIPTVTLAMEHGVSAPRVGFVPFPYNLVSFRVHEPLADMLKRRRSRRADVLTSEA